MSIRWMTNSVLVFIFISAIRIISVSNDFEGNMLFPLHSNLNQLLTGNCRNGGQSMQAFRNGLENNVSFDQIFDKILSYVEKFPNEKYRLIIGTDSQVHSRNTVFITGVILQKNRKAVLCYNKRSIVNRKMENLYERISYETSLSEEIASLLTFSKREQILEFISPYSKQGGEFVFEGHLDIGKGLQNKTRKYVSEMAKRIESFGLVAIIKPNSYGASSYANKYTK